MLYTKINIKMDLDKILESFVDFISDFVLKNRVSYLKKSKYSSTIQEYKYMLCFNLLSVLL